MTLEEYLRDRKRLFAIMDKGFKIVLHKEGVSEKVIQQHEQNGYAPLPKPRATKKTLNGTQEASSPMPVLSGQSATYLKLPGVQRILVLMTKKEQELFTILLDHDGEWFSREKLPFLLGYASKDSMRVSLNFGKMVSRGWIEQERINGSLSYRTNMKGKMS
jgi:hypothetical protein